MDILNSIILDKDIQLKTNFALLHANMGLMKPDIFNTIMFNITGAKNDDIIYNYVTCTQDFGLKYEELEYKDYDSMSTNIRIIVSFTDTTFVLDSASIENIAKYIKTNIKIRRIFIPLSYSHYSLKAGHQSCIMIDNYDKKIYIIDPNGLNMITDNLLQTSTLFHVETLVSKLFNKLQKYDLDYCFVHSNEYNLKNYNLNHIISKKIGTDGECVVITLFYIKLFTVLEELDPREIIEMLQTCDTFSTVMKFSEQIYEQYLKNNFVIQNNIMQYILDNEKIENINDILITV